MTAAVTGDTTNYSKDCDITQQVATWSTTIDWPKDLTGATSDVVVDGKATITYTPGTNGSAGTVAVAYSAK